MPDRRGPRHRHVEALAGPIGHIEGLPARYAAFMEITDRQAADYMASVTAAGASANPFGWKALRGSMGSGLRLPVATHSDAAAAVATARRHGCRIIAAAPRGGRPMYDVDLTAPSAVLRTVVVI